MRYKIHNGGKSERGLHDAKGRVVVLKPGETRAIELNDVAVKFIRVGAARGDKLTIADGSDTTSEPEAVKVSPDYAPVVITSESRVSSAAALIDKSEDIDFNAFKTEAKSVLGDKWPGGMPKKHELIELLMASV